MLWLYMTFRCALFSVISKKRDLLCRPPITKCIKYLNCLIKCPINGWIHHNERKKIEYMVYLYLTYIYLCDKTLNMYHLIMNCLNKWIIVIVFMNTIFVLLYLIFIVQTKQCGTSTSQWAQHTYPTFRNKTTTIKKRQWPQKAKSDKDIYTKVSA